MIEKGIYLSEINSFVRAQQKGIWKATEPKIQDEQTPPPCPYVRMPMPLIQIQFDDLTRETEGRLVEGWQIFPVVLNAITIKEWQNRQSIHNHHMLERFASCTCDLSRPILAEAGGFLQYDFCPEGMSIPVDKTCEASNPSWSKSQPQPTLHYLWEEDQSKILIHSKSKMASSRIYIQAAPFIWQEVRSQGVLTWGGGEVSIRKIRQVEQLCTISILFRYCELIKLTDVQSLHWPQVSRN